MRSVGLLLLIVGCFCLFAVYVGNKNHLQTFTIGLQVPVFLHYIFDSYNNLISFYIVVSIMIPCLGK